MTEDDDEKESGLGGLSLPPITLPPVILPVLRLPEFVLTRRKRGRSEPVRLSARTALFAALLVDAVDAGLLLAGVAPIRAVWIAVGAGVALVLAGRRGLLFGWEIGAIAAGVGWLGAAPTATLLLLSRLLR